MTAQKVKLRAKAKDPKIQAKLAPFTTPGYLQLNHKMSYQKEAFSYTEILQSGALTQSQAGLQKMVMIAFTRDDKDRPRLHFQIDFANGWQKSNEDREMVMELQQLLIELGPTLAELGVLKP